VSIIILSTNLRPKRVDGDLLRQILSVLRSPDSSILDGVVPNLDLRSVVPNMYIIEGRTLTEYVRRLNAYVDGRRTSIEYVRGYARRRKTRTLVEHIRRKHVRASSKYVVAICVRHQITYVRQLRTHDRKTYVGNIRTSTNHVHQYNVAESRSSYARKMRTLWKIRTSVEDVRQQNMYAQINIAEFVLTVVDLPECVLRISISMVVVGTRCLAQMTDGSRNVHESRL